MTRRNSCRLLLALAALFASPLIAAQAADELTRLQDRAAIGEALAQYAYRWDSKDSDAFAALFTEDAVMERWRGGSLIDDSVLRGRPAILLYAQNSHRGRLADRQTRHHFSNLVFLELSAASAVTENMALITHQTAQDTVARLSSSGIYRISWQKSAGEWKIARRSLFTDSFPVEGTGRE